MNYETENYGVKFPGMTDGLIRLESVAMDVLGLSVVIAKRKFALGELPLPAFRMTDTGRGPIFITQSALRDYVDGRAAAAEKFHRQMMSVMS